VVLRLEARDDISKFIDSLQRKVQSHEPVSTNDAGHWLAILLDHARRNHAATLDGSLRNWSKLRENGSQQKRRELWLEMKRDQAGNMAAIEQAEALQEHAGYDVSDPSFASTRLLRRMHAEYSAQTEGIRILIDNEMQMKSMEVAQMSINESRSAIAGKLQRLGQTLYMTR